MWKCEREGIREDGETRRSSHSPQALAWGSELQKILFNRFNGFPEYVAG